MYFHILKQLKYISLESLFRYLVSISLFNSFQANVPFLHPLKTLENFWLSDVFRGCRNETLPEMGNDAKLEYTETRPFHSCCNRKTRIN